LGIESDVYGAYRYHAVTEILRDAERFDSSAYVRGMGMVFGHSTLEMDGNEHLRHRGLVNQAFRPKVLQRWESELLLRVINEAIDSFVSRGRAELVREFTYGERLCTSAIHYVLKEPTVPVAVLREASGLLHLISSVPKLCPKFSMVSDRDWAAVMK
jgi:hypothetical protein